MTEEMEQVNESEKIALIGIKKSSKVMGKLYKNAFFRKITSVFSYLPDTLYNKRASEILMLFLSFHEVFQSFILERKQKFRSKIIIFPNSLEICPVGDGTYVILEVDEL